MDEDDDDPVPLPNVNGAIMRKVGVLGEVEEGSRVCVRVSDVHALSLAPSLVI